MLSFRSIFVAAVALATFTSAVPVGTDPTGGATDSLGNVLGGDLLKGGLVKRGGGEPTCKTPPDIFKTCHDGIAPIVVEIKAIVAVPGFDHGKVTDCFNQIGVLLGVAIADLKVTIAAKLALEGLLILNGVACTLADLGGIVYALLLLVIEVLVIVLHIVINIDVTLCGLLYSIGVLLVEIITLVVGLVAGLDVVLAGLVVAIAGDITLLKCDPILVLLGIKA